MTHTTSAAPGISRLTTR